MSAITITLDGVAYVPIADAARKIDRCDTTVYRWAEAGAVRDLYRVLGRKRRHLVSVEDVAALAEMTSEESLAQGIFRASPRIKAYTARYREMMQQRTRPTAEHHRELYDDYDIDKILSTMETLTIEEQAKILGRTYAAMASERGKVRRLEGAAR
jgi:hypothetical protein